MAAEPSDLIAGIDIGSTTTKLAVLAPGSHELLFSDYRRHHANQLQSLQEALALLRERFGDVRFKLALTGSGAKLLAEKLELAYIQEVVANSIFLKENYPQVRTAIELGGQDAKVLFFSEDATTGNLNVADMRMNGACAGGTGAFIDEVASILKVAPEDFNALAARGTHLYDISGRCGVYAKTDIQPLLNQGVERADLALSALHAIAKQTIGGLAQGLDIEPPVAFEGGPLTYIPQLVDVFAQRLKLAPEHIIHPETPELVIAKGAALALEGFFAETDTSVQLAQLQARAEHLDARALMDAGKEGQPYFASPEECAAYRAAHALPAVPGLPAGVTGTLPVYLGIDSGSTTTKFVLLGEDGELIDSFYSSNEGEPLQVAQAALVAMRDKYRARGVELDVIACGTTGYGENLFAEAFRTETHTVETVAHAKATARYIEDASFILDIGGQDMKAIWLEDGIITNVVVNEACSSGCGSFLENFPTSLDIPVERIADEAFASRSPAVLGSRCTVFMNSSIVTEQRNGKQPGDIMAGLTRSIIENVFTKVIRMQNLASLGDRIVVQGGTFQNDAVLRAMELYLGKEVTRAPYPGIMGAIGAGLLAREAARKPGFTRTFIGIDAAAALSYTTEANNVCPFCGNHCKRSVIHFSNGHAYVTNNRCERGEVLGDPKSAEVRAQVKAKNTARSSVPNLYELRSKLLFADYPIAEGAPKRGVTIGIPRILNYWETAPFWTTFWRSLGFDVQLSGFSTRAMYEEGLHAVTSDTECFPAKLMHGHVRDLVARGADRIFVPSITTMPTENTESTSISMCGLVKGYPIVLRNSDNPEKQWGVPLDSPLFHWYTTADRDRQLPQWMAEQFGIGHGEVMAAIEAADAAQASFHEQLTAEGARVIEQVTAEGGYAVVLASRPYHNDALVNHDLPRMLARMGVPVLTPDAVPGIDAVDMRNSRIDVVNNYHARMLSTAILAAENPHLEYIQLVSFGCGHDAYLSDEIIRMMHEISGATPLVLKVDESDATGSISIRVRSFIETIQMKRELHTVPEVHALADPYPVKFTKERGKTDVVLVPNTSHAFSLLMAAVFSRQGVEAVSLPIGRERAIQLGKQYVHNDICFPAQIVIGEELAALESGDWDGKNVSVGMGKYVGCCRLTHYSALLRKALDEMGYPEVAIMTNDDVDYHDMHPGFQMSLASAINVALGLPMIDALEALLRKMRPYELVEGSSEAAFEEAVDVLMAGIRAGGIAGTPKAFEKSIEIMQRVEYDRSELRPTVLIVGEYLLNFHPGANHDIEQYLEDNGFEIIEARMTDVIRKTYFYQNAQDHEYKIKRSAKQKLWYETCNRVFDIAHDITDRIGASHPLYEPPCNMRELVKDSDPIFHHTYDSGEGVLIPAEIVHHAKHGCKSFVILQPFGCLPNHVVGRGIVKKLKELYPDVQILPLDYDPDVSFANIENRLQMLVMNQQTMSAQEQQEQESAA